MNVSLKKSEKFVFFHESWNQIGLWKEELSKDTKNEKLKVASCPDILNMKYPTQEAKWTLKIFRTTEYLRETIELKFDNWIQN